MLKPAAALTIATLIAAPAVAQPGKRTNRSPKFILER